MAWYLNQYWLIINGVCGTHIRPIWQVVWKILFHKISLKNTGGDAFSGDFPLSLNMDAAVGGLQPVGHSGEVLCWQYIGGVVMLAVHDEKSDNINIQETDYICHQNSLYSVEVMQWTFFSLEFRTKNLVIYNKTIKGVIMDAFFSVPPDPVWQLQSEWTNPGDFWSCRHVRICIAGATTLVLRGID